MPESRSRLTARKINIEDVINGNYYQQDGFDPNYIITPYGLRVSRGRILGTVMDTYINDDESYGALTLDDGTDTIRAKFFQDLDMMADIEKGDIVEVVGKVKEYDNEIYVNPELIIPRNATYELLRAVELTSMRDEWRDHIETAKRLQDAGKSDEDIEQELKGEGLGGPEIEGILKYVTLGEEAFEKGTQTTTTENGATITQSTSQAQTHPTVDDEDADDSADEDEDDESGDHRADILDAIEDLDDGDGADYGAIQDAVDIDEDTMEDAVNDLLSDGTCYEPRPGRIKKL